MSIDDSQPLLAEFLAPELWIPSAALKPLNNISWLFDADNSPETNEELYRQFYPEIHTCYLLLAMAAMPFTDFSEDPTPKIPVMSHVPNAYIWLEDEGQYCPFTNNQTPFVLRGVASAIVYGIKDDARTNEVSAEEAAIWNGGLWLALSSRRPATDKVTIDRALVPIREDSAFYTVGTLSN